MATAQTDERLMISERLAPGMLPRVLNSFDMTIIFVAIVLFIVNASAMQQAHQAAYTYWILGFLAFLIPGALITAQLGLMFPQEGSLAPSARGSLFTVHNWRIWLAVMCGVSLAAAVGIYAISEYTHRRETRFPRPTTARVDP